MLCAAHSSVSYSRFVLSNGRVSRLNKLHVEFYAASDHAFGTSSPEIVDRQDAVRGESVDNDNAAKEEALYLSCLNFEYSQPINAALPKLAGITCSTSRLRASQIFRPRQTRGDVTFELSTLWCLQWNFVRRMNGVVASVCASFDAMRTDDEWIVLHFRVEPRG